MAALKEIKLIKSECWSYVVPDEAEELFQLEEPLWVSVKPGHIISITSNLTKTPKNSNLEQCCLESSNGTTL